MPCHPIISRDGVRVREYDQMGPNFYSFTRKIRTQHTHPPYYRMAFLVDGFGFGFNALGNASSMTVNHLFSKLASKWPNKISVKNCGLSLRSVEIHSLTRLFAHRVENNLNTETNKWLVIVIVKSNAQAHSTALERTEQFSQLKYIYFDWNRFNVSVFLFFLAIFLFISICRWIGWMEAHSILI